MGWGNMGCMELHKLFAAKIENCLMNQSSWLVAKYPDALMSILKIVQDY